MSGEKKVHLVSIHTPTTMDIFCEKIIVIQCSTNTPGCLLNKKKNMMMKIWNSVWTNPHV